MRNSKPKYPKPSVRWIKGTIVKINHAQMGIGGLIETNEGKTINAGCTSKFPQDAKISDKYHILLSFNHIMKTVKINGE